jgi:2-polyprenyl-6-methoxyphenol hydroxylase-like FAD-dependent oxidoreductase
LKKAVDAVAQDTWNKYYRHDGTPLLGPFPNPPRVGRIFIRKQWQELILAEVKRVGIPIFFGDKVVDYFETETKGGVILQSSRKFEADLVAACDGVHSRSWKLVLGQKVEPFPIGFSIMRCSMPTKQALQNTAVREKFGRKLGSDGKTHDTLEFLIGPDIHANMTVSEDVTCWLLVYKVGLVISDQPTIRTSLCFC